MKKALLVFIIAILTPLFAFAKEYGWICADYAKGGSWFVFVYENVSKPVTKYGRFKVWVEWKFYTPKAQADFKTKARSIKELYEISYDFSEYRILQSTSYDKEDKVIESISIPTEKEYIIPCTIGENIIETTKEIIKGDRTSEK